MVSAISGAGKTSQEATEAAIAAGDKVTGRDL
jgi:hypothetical protein